jgi:hypothetical protein
MISFKSLSDMFARIEHTVEKFAVIYIEDAKYCIAVDEIRASEKLTEFKLRLTIWSEKGERVTWFYVYPDDEQDLIDSEMQAEIESFAKFLEEAQEDV